MIRKKKRYILIRTDTEVSDLALEIRKKIKSDYGDERFKFGLKIYVKTNETAIIRINNLYIDKLYKIFSNINNKNEIIIPIISSGTIKKIKRHLESYKNIKIN